MNANENHIKKKVFLRIRKAALWINFGLLFCHIYFLWAFYQMGVMAMFYVNIASIAIYLFTFWLTKNEKTLLFIIVTFLELYIHMLLAILCVGWDFGFQQYCYGLIPAILFTDYLLNKNLKILKSSIVCVIVCFITYIALQIWTMNHTPFYEDILDVSTAFSITNTFFTFGFLTTYTIFFGSTAYRQERTLKVQADYDALTKLRNRRHIQNLMDKYTQNFENEEKIYIGIMDIDFFKQINDTYGHNMGDEVLQAIGEILIKHEHDYPDFFAARWGGEEFLLFYSPGTDLHTKFETIINSIHKTIREKNFICEDKAFNCTVTIGVAKHVAGQDIEITLHQADQMLYIGKRGGRNQVQYFTADEQSSSTT